MMLNKSLFIIGLILLCFSCDSPLEDEISNETEERTTVDENIDYNLDWIAGVWKDETSFLLKKEVYAEQWVKNEDESYSGVNFTIVNGDTSDNKTYFTLTKKGDKYWNEYELDGKQKEYIQDSINRNFIRFSHLKDEFPHTIQYWKNKNSLLVTISGNVNGINRAFTFKTIKSNQ